MNSITSRPFLLSFYLLLIAFMFDIVTLFILHTRKSSFCWQFYWNRQQISLISIHFSNLFSFRLGLDPKLLAQILNMSSGRCWSSDTYNPVPGVMEGVPSANNYQGGFGTTLMAKVLYKLIFAISFFHLHCKNCSNCSLSRTTQTVIKSNIFFIADNFLPPVKNCTMMC